MNEIPACLICSRDLWEDELGRYACRPCQQRIDTHLRELAGPRGLYARLCLRIQPDGRSAGTRVTGSPAAPIPGSLDVLSLTANGGIVSTLESWVEDWASQGFGVRGDGGRLQHRVDQAIETLRRNLDHACRRHPALDECAAEISRINRQARALVDGEKQPSRVAVTCPCGGTLRVTIDTPGETCRSCGAEYGQTEVLRLPLARAAA